MFACRTLASRRKFESGRRRITWDRLRARLCWGCSSGPVAMVRLGPCRPPLGSSHCRFAACPRPARFGHKQPTRTRLKPTSRHSLKMLNDQASSYQLTRIPSRPALLATCMRLSITSHAQMLQLASSSRCSRHSVQAALFRLRCKLHGQVLTNLTGSTRQIHGGSHAGL